MKEKYIKLRISVNDIKYGQKYVSASSDSFKPIMPDKAE